MTYLPGIDSWDDLEDIGFHLEDIGNPREEKRSREKRSKKEGADASTPSFGEKIRDKALEYSDVVKELASKDFYSARQIHQIVLDEFLPHWEEKGEKAKKARWEKETSFDYLLRLRKWIANKHSWAKDWRCRDGMWHQKGDKCYCVKEEKPPPRPPISAEVRALAAGKRVSD